MKRQTYVLQCLRSHKGKGPYRVQVVAIRGEVAVLRWLSHRRKRDFTLPLWMLAHPTCGWAQD